MSSSKLSTSAQIAEDNARIAGVQKYCMSQTSILVESVAYTPVQVIAVYQAEIDALGEVAAAEMALAEARTKAKPASLARKQLDHGFKRSIEGAYGNSPTTLGTFGIVLATPKVLTAAEKAAAATKAAATRALRHTMGKNQKAKLTASTATPAEPSPAASPAAPSAGGAGGK